MLHLINMFYTSYSFDRLLFACLVLEDLSLEVDEYNCGFDDDPHYKICVPTLRRLSMAFNISEIFGDIDCKLEINTLDRDGNFALPRLTCPSLLRLTWAFPTPYRWWGGDGARF